MISIVIPSYNRQSVISETLNSIRDQTYAEWECIIVDDQSSDNTVDVIREYERADSRFRLLIRPDDVIKGACSCRNQGMDAAGGEYVYFFDSDDVLSATMFEVIIPELRDNPSAVVASFGVDYFLDNPSEPICRRPTLKNGQDVIEAARGFKIPLGTQCFMWSRAFLLEIGVRWRSDVLRYQDHDFNGRALTRAHQGIWVNSLPLVHLRDSGDDRITEQFKPNSGYSYALILDDLYADGMKFDSMTSALHRRWMIYVLDQQYKSAQQGLFDLSMGLHQILMGRRKDTFWNKIIGAGSWSVRKTGYVIRVVFLARFKLRRFVKMILVRYFNYQTAKPQIDS